MPNLIRQIVTDEEFGSQTIRMTVTANERGPQGEKGEQGDAATIEAGQAYSVNPGDNPQVINTGTSSAAVFDFYIPKGVKGDTGPEGPPGRDGKDPVWGNIEGTLSNQADLQSALNSKQDSLIAGDNIELDNNTISATDTTYTAGSGLNLNGTQFSVDTSQIQPKLSAGINIQINGDTISATDTTYSAGSGLNLNGGEFSVNTSTIQPKLTAGSNVQINGNTISATDTTYTAGNAITIDSGNNNAINAAINPADFFTNTASTVTGTGSSFTMNNTAGFGLNSVQIDGDTTQQTYSGKNLFLWIPTTSPSHGLSSTYDSATGTVSITGTASENWSDISGTFTTSIPVGTYTLSLSKTATTLGFNDVTLHLVGSSTQQVHIYSNANKISFTTTEIKTSLRVVVGTDKNTQYNTTFTVQLEAGSTATPYEPYVGGIPAPNPDYPQTVNTVTGRQVVDVYDKNLYPGRIYKTNYVISSNGSEVSSNGGVISEAFQISPNTAYTLSWSTTALGNGMRVAFYQSDMTFIQRIDFTTAAETFTSPANAKYARLSYFIGDVSWVQFELGSTPTPYQTHQSYEVNLGKNLFDKDNANIANVWADASVVIDGAALRTLYIPCEHDTTYTIQKENTGTNNRFMVFTTNAVPAAGVTVLNYVGTSGAADNNASYTITTPSTAKYLCVFFANVNSTTPSVSDILATIQIEKGSTATSYAPYFTPIELCKIGTYQDYIYKSGSDWYIHKATNKIEANGTESWSLFQASSAINAFYIENTGGAKGSATSNPVISNRFIPRFETTIGSILLSGNVNFIGRILCCTDSTDFPNLSTWTTWLASNTMTIYYGLATATDTQITNADLISQLNALAGATTYDGQTIITVTSDNQLAILDVETYRKSLAGIIAAIKES